MKLIEEIIKNICCFKLYEFRHENLNLGIYGDEQQGVIKNFLHNVVYVSNAIDLFASSKNPATGGDVSLKFEDLGYERDEVELLKNNLFAINSYRNSTAYRKFIENDFTFFSCGFIYKVKVLEQNLNSMKIRITNADHTHHYSSIIDFKFENNRIKSVNFEYYNMLFKSNGEYILPINQLSEILKLLNAIEQIEVITSTGSQFMPLNLQQGENVFYKIYSVLFSNLKSQNLIKTEISPFKPFLFFNAGGEYFLKFKFGEEFNKAIKAKYNIATDEYKLSINQNRIQFYFYNPNRRSNYSIYLNSDYEMIEYYLSHFDLCKLPKIYAKCNLTF